MKLEQVNTREKLTIRLYDRRGRTIRANTRRIYRLMRCHLTGRRRVMNWRLIRALYKISRHYHGKTVRIYSGYRARKVAALSESYHIKGRAMDIAVRGVNKRALRDYLRRTFKRSGVGYYPNTPFVHFDVRNKRAFWVDVSGSGQPSRYVQAYDYLKRERRAAKKGSVNKGAAKKRAVKVVAKAAVPRTKVAPAKAALAQAAPNEATTETSAAGKAPSATAAQPTPAQPAKAGDVAESSSKPVVVAGPDPVGPPPPPAQDPAAQRAPAPPPDRDDVANKAPTSTSGQKLAQDPDRPAARPKPERAPVSKIRSAP